MNSRQKAIAAVRASLGLSNYPGDWTYLERVNYNRELAAYIAANSAEFPPQDVEVAQNIQAQTVSPLGDTGFVANIDAFGSAFTDELLNAGDKIADVGRGALNTVSLAGKLMPVALVFVALYYVLKFKKDLDA